MRRCMSRERRRLPLMPEPDRNARLRSPSAAGALVCRGARDAHRFQPGHARCRFIGRNALQAAIDDDPNAINGDGGFRNRSRQHDLAGSGSRRPDRLILLLLREVAIKRNDQNIRSERPA